MSETDLESVDSVARTRDSEAAPSQTDQSQTQLKLIPASTMLHSLPAVRLRTNDPSTEQHAARPFGVCRGLLTPLNQVVHEAGL